jgi:hypothetical protein
MPTGIIVQSRPDTLTDLTPDGGKNNNQFKSFSGKSYNINKTNGRVALKDTDLIDGVLLEDNTTDGLFYFVAVGHINNKNARSLVEGDPVIFTREHRGKCRVRFNNSLEPEVDYVEVYGFEALPEKTRGRQLLQEAVDNGNQERVAQIVRNIDSGISPEEGLV